MESGSKRGQTNPFLSAKASVLCAVATPFDVKNGRGQIPGVSQVGHSHNGSTGSLSDSDVYNIKFTFAASPHAKAEGSPVSEAPTTMSSGCCCFFCQTDSQCNARHWFAPQRCIQLPHMWGL